MSELHASDFEPEDDERGVEMLPLVLRRFEVYAPGPNEGVDENEWGITVPFSRLDIPDLDVDPKYLAGARFEVSKLPGAGHYEILFVYTLFTEAHIERQERREARIAAQYLEEMENPDA